MQSDSKIIGSKTLLIHLAVWALVFLLPYAFATENPRQDDADALAFRRLDTITNVFWVGLFYLNALVLIPQLFYSKKYFFLVVSLLASFAFIILLRGSLFPLLVSGKHFIFSRSASHNILAFLFTITVSTTYKIVTDKITTDSRATELQKENLKTELSFLRSQISPHFLFNLLNNIVAMVRLKSEQLEPTIIKLSNLLQYMLYETDDEKILLKQEVESLQNYIDLQKIRFTEQLNLTTNFDVQQEWNTIEPMLLIPFVENAFKHGNTSQHKQQILINLSTQANQLTFNVSNTFEASDQVKDKTSGIGLANVKRRLQLLYPAKHSLDISTKDGWFMVELKITLK